MALQLTQTAVDELTEVAQSGFTNMFDRQAVIFYARNAGYDVIAEIAENQKEDWASIIFGDFEIVG